MRHRLVLLSAIAGIGLLAWPGISQNQVPPKTATGDGEEKQAQAVIAATTPYEAVAAYGKLFKSATTEKLRRLQMNAADSVAIQAAWGEIELSIPERPERTIRPDRDKLARFLGFLEGRARVQAPQWWTDAILDARANCRGNVYAGGLNLGRYQNPKPKAALLPPEAKLEKADGKSIVRIGSEIVSIPHDLHKQLTQNSALESLTALITPERLYVAAYDSVGYPYQLACVERTSVKTRWSAEVWASWWGGSEGHHHQDVQVIEQGNRVVVFGVAAVGFHVEAFRIDDGANMFRFSNSYGGWSAQR